MGKQKVFCHVLHFFFFLIRKWVLDCSFFFLLLLIRMSDVCGVRGLVSVLFFNINLMRHSLHFVYAK